MNWKGKILVGLSTFLTWGGWLMSFVWAAIWGHNMSDQNIAFAIAFSWAFGGLFVAIVLTCSLFELFEKKFPKKFPASPTPEQGSTPKIDFRPPPKDLFEYGKDVELPEKREEPKIINPWQKRVTAGGGQ